MQKPGEGETLTVTFEVEVEAMNGTEQKRGGPSQSRRSSVGRPPENFFFIIIMDEQTQEQKQSESVARFRRTPSRTAPAHFFLAPSDISCSAVSLPGSFNIARDVDRALLVASTPLPDPDDDLSTQKYISDRRVIGVRRSSPRL